MSKPVTETELVVKVRKALNSQESELNKTVQVLQSQNNILSSILDNKQKSQNGAGRMFEDEIFNKILQFNKIISDSKKNVVIFGQEIDIIAFTRAPLPFSVLIFETKYFPNAKLIGSANEDTKIIVDGKEVLSEKRRNLFEQTDNQFKQVSKKMEKVLKENNFNERDEFYRPFIQTFAVFTDSTDISGLNLQNTNRYTKFLKAKELTQDLIIKTVFSLPKRNVTQQVKDLIQKNLF
jgi:hypothetical protein